MICYAQKFAIHENFNLFSTIIIVILSILLQIIGTLLDMWQCLATELYEYDQNCSFKDS